MAKRNVSFQKTSVEEPTVEEGTEQEAEPNVVRETPFGAIMLGKFRISIPKNVKNAETGKMEKVIAYENEEEPFEYPKVNSLVMALVHAGGEFTDEQIKQFASAIGEKNGPAVVKLTKIYNDKLRADAKSSAYQSLVSKHKPLEGEEREVAIAKAIRQFVRVANISVETAIDVLKAQKAVPPEYSVTDYNEVKLRKSKLAEEADDEE